MTVLAVFIGRTHIELAELAELALFQEQSWRRPSDGRLFLLKFLSGPFGNSLVGNCLQSQCQAVGTVVLVAVTTVVEVTSQCSVARKRGPLKGGERDIVRTSVFQLVDPTRRETKPRGKKEKKQKHKTEPTDPNALRRHVKDKTQLLTRRRRQMHRVLSPLLV